MDFLRVELYSKNRCQIIAFINAFEQYFISNYYINQNILHEQKC